MASAPCEHASVWRACILVVVACSAERRPATSPPEVPSAESDRAAEAAPPVPPADAPAIPVPDAALPRTLDDALAALRARELGAAADVIERRAAQKQRKMKLSGEAALAAALALLDLAEREPVRALVTVMPRSTVELARAVRERGVPVEGADEIARYLVRVVEVLQFDRLSVFDENHSHVTGRQWHEIDYSGEGMTWQGQRDYWTPRGVRSFTRAADIHAYFVGAEKLPHWNRVYRPRGKMADVAPPSGR